MTTDPWAAALTHLTDLDSHRTRTNVRVEVDGEHVADAILVGHDERGVFIAIDRTTPSPRTEETP
jgi:hypothetical protein